jgi:hypothetical protein
MAIIYSDTSMSCEDWQLIEPVELAVSADLCEPREPDTKNAISHPCQLGSAVLVSVQMQPHIRTVPAGDSATVMGMASLRVPGNGAESQVSQLDIIAVVDRSGSMGGQRMELVKSAVGFISRHLRPKDRLALVSYSDSARIDFSLSFMDKDGQSMCAQALTSLHAGGATNLGEGLLWGLGELASSDASAAALLLFTDGLANRGIMETHGLLEAMQGPMSDMGRKSRAVFTLGFGSEHNAEMLFSIADAGTGCYSYISTPANIGPCFADVLGGMLSITAQDVELVLRATNGSDITHVHADFDVNMNADCTEARIRMRDLQGDTEKDVLFSLKLPALAAPLQMWQGLECTVSYVGAVDGLASSTVAYLDFVRPDVNASCERPDDMVESHRCRLLAATVLEKAAHLTGGASLSDAHSVLSDAIVELEKSPALQSAEKKAAGRVRDLIADLRFCLEHSTDSATCTKWCSSRAFAHKHQTSTSGESSAYRNALQEQLIEAAQREINQLQHVSCYSRTTGSKSLKSAQKCVHAVVQSHGVRAAGHDTIEAGALCIGMRAMCRGKPGVLTEVCRSKTGKHGHAKVFMTVSCDDGVVRQDVIASSNTVELAL